MHLRANQLECRPAQLFGAWACEASYLRSFVEQARMADLVALRSERRAEMADAKAAMADGGEDPDPLYWVDCGPLGNEPGVAIIELSGPLTKYPTSFQSLFGGTSTLLAREALRVASRDPQICGIIVKADTPGGTHAGTGDLADAIRAVAQIKPVFSYAEDLACSAGLWAISAGQTVLANATAMIGSIGVYSVLIDRSKQYAQAGVEVHVVSSAPPIKGAGVEGSKVVPAQLEDFKRMVDDMSAVFVSSVAAFRGMDLKDVQALATGQVWGAAEALDKGLIDGICSLDEAIAAVRKETQMITKPATATNPDPTPTASASAAPSTPPAPPAVAAAPTAPAADGSVTISRAELDSLRASAAQTAQLVKADRERRFKGLAKELSLPDAMATALDTVEASVPAETFGALETAFRAAGAQLKASKGGLFTERGTGDPGEASAADPHEQLSGIAKAMVEKGEAKTFPAAYAMAADRNPDLASKIGPNRG